MERDANYAAVGAFVLLIGAGGGGVRLLVLRQPRAPRLRPLRDLFHRQRQRPDKGAAVRYLGVGVGRVQNIRVDPRDSGRVQVIVDIDTTTPVSEHTVAQLQLQGVTGLLYIDLMEDRDNKRAAPPSGA